MSDRLVAAFRGSVQCQHQAGAVQWRLRGIDSASGAALEVSLSGGAGMQLPAQLADAELHVRDEFTNTAWELRSDGQSLPLTVRAVQVHRNAEEVFAGALPGTVAPWSARAGWVLLLNALRVPGVVRLLRRLRGHGNEL